MIQLRCSSRVSDDREAIGYTNDHNHPTSPHITVRLIIHRACVQATDTLHTTLCAIFSDHMFS